MPRRRRQLIEHPRIHRCPIGDHLDRRHLGRPDGALEEPAGRRGVPPRRDEHVDDLAELVDRPVDVVPLPGDLDVRLVGPTTGLRPRAGTAGRSRPAAARSVAPTGTAWSTSTPRSASNSSTSGNTGRTADTAAPPHDHLGREPEAGEHRGSAVTGRDRRMILTPPVSLPQPFRAQRNSAVPEAFAQVSARMGAPDRIRTCAHGSGGPVRRAGQWCQRTSTHRDFVASPVKRRWGWKSGVQGEAAIDRRRAVIPRGNGVAAGGGCERHQLSRAASGPQRRSTGTHGHFH